MIDAPREKDRGIHLRHVQGRAISCVLFSIKVLRITDLLRDGPIMARSFRTGLKRAPDQPISPRIKRSRRPAGRRIRTAADALDARIILFRRAGKGQHGFLQAAPQIADNTQINRRPPEAASQGTNRADALRTTCRPMIPRTFLPVIPELAQRIDDLLPQTQCTKCGFDGCTPYARAIADGRADFNQCPPGGQEGVARLAQLLGRPEKPLDVSHGVERPRPRAVIDECVCIGCTLCAKACPVDAIVGAAKLMHTVLNDACTGCDLCVAPCPVDCIEMVPVSGDATGWDAWSATQAAAARAQHARRNARLAAEQQAADERAALRVRQSHTPLPPHLDGSGATGTAGPNGAEIGSAGDASVSDAATSDTSGSRPAAESGDGAASIEALERARKQAIIQAALERARARRAAGQPDALNARKPPGT